LDRVPRDLHWLNDEPDKESTVTRTSSRWIAAIALHRPTRISSTATRTATLGVAAAAIMGGFIATPAAALASPPAAAPADGAVPAAAAPAPAAAAPAPAAAKALPHEALLQPNGYYCGPTATRIAMTAHGVDEDWNDIAHELGTTEDGTASANDVTRVLNAHLGANRYHTTEIGTKANAQQVEDLRRDVVQAAAIGDPVVANIAGTVVDNAGDAHSYAGGHYLTVTGYADQGRQVTITDPADRVGSSEYQIGVGQLADWISSRGYSS
jgi:hypothetical protein